MWNPLVVDDRSYLIQCISDARSCRVYLTDIFNVWMEELTAEQLSRRCKEVNPLIEADYQKLVEQVLTLFKRQENADVCLSADGSSVSLKLKSAIAGVPFYLIFHMMKTSPETVCEVLSLPLVKVIIRQQWQIKQLCEMLKAKDAEIQQYKLEGAVLKKRKLETETFTEKTLNNMHDGPENELSENIQQPACLFNSSLLSSLAAAAPKQEALNSLPGSQEEKPVLQETEIQQLANPSSSPREPMEGSSTNLIPKVEPGAEPATVVPKVEPDSSPVPKKRVMKQNKPAVNRPKLRL